MKNEDEFSVIHASVSYFASLTPDQVAVQEEVLQLTYRQLDQAMCNVAYRLLNSTVKKGGRVGLLFENGANGIVAILGILRAGACYVPINTALPVKAMLSVLSEAGVTDIITDQKNIEILRKLPSFFLSSLTLYVFEDSTQVTALERFEIFKKVILFSPFTPILVGSLPITSQEEDLAYIMFTSGSTGVPKGVMIHHQNVVNLLKWGKNCFQFTSKDRFSGHSRFHFDLSVWDIFMCFWVGATLCPITCLGDQLLPEEFIESRRITAWCSVPFLIDFMGRQEDPRAKSCGESSLRVAIFCGEILSTSLASKFQQIYPKAKLINCYGPTECTVFASYHIVASRVSGCALDIPIGILISNVSMRVLDRDLRDTRRGEVGTLFLSGPQLSSGYWSKEELSAAKFILLEDTLREGQISASAKKQTWYNTGDLVKLDQQGLLYFKGRGDNQVKIRGNRVELEGIESLLLSSCIEVKEAVVVFNTFPEQELVLVVVPAQVRSKDDYLYLERKVLEVCQKEFPSYMVPSKVVTVSHLARTSNGKIDRQAIQHQIPPETI